MSFNRTIFTLTLSMIGIMQVSLSIAQEKINWISIEEAQVLSKNNPRKFMVDVYTDWCGWCKKMEKGTFKEPHIVKYINDNYYAIKFNAETKEQVEFNGKSYKFVKSGNTGYNELALAFSKGKLSYPTIVFLDENYKVIQPIQGYLTAQKFEKIITFFGKNHHKTTPWVTYERNYVPMQPAFVKID